MSIHQKTFLEAVAAQAAVAKVLLVVEHDITDYRKNMGWDAPVFTNVEVVTGPSKQQIKDIVHANKEAVHIMGGIRVGSMLAVAFDRCVKESCKLGIMTEPYNDAGYKGRLRKLKYRYYKMRYFKHVQFVLAIGRQGVKQYAGLGFDTRRIFPWAYFITVPVSERTNGVNGIKRIIYAGRLEAAKGILRFTEELVKTGSVKYTLDIYGAGADEENLKQLISANKLQDRIHIHPFLKYDELVKEYRKYDWVVLPSAAKDGWGVIVSEGLLNGLKGICSNICGVSWVIKDRVNGVVFDWWKEESCGNAINSMLNEDTFADAGTISQWAQKSISAEAGAAYFMQVMDCVYEDKKKPAIPWE